MPLEKTLANFSEDPKEQARQTQELERNVQESMSGSDEEIKDLKARLTELESIVAGHHP